MDSRSVAFLEVMAAIGIVGLVAFLIFLVSRQAVRAQAGGAAAAYRPQWVELLLAAAALLIIVIAFVWQFPPWGGAGTGDAAAGQSATYGRAQAFFVVMLVIGGAGLIVFLLTMFWQLGRQRTMAGERGATASQPGVAAPVAAGVSGATSTSSPTAVAAKASHETPSAIRLLGLLGFGVAYLVLNWSTVPYVQQHTMMLHLIYPAGMIVALVMMFDKASRAWHVKLPGETLREWLFCDAILVLYLIAYLNLLSVDPPDEYRAMFWDFLQVVGFLLVLWLVDRKTTRLRFLIARAYLIALPVLLLIWRSSQGVEIPADISWWHTIWPFFFLALIFFVLEIIILIANRDNASQGAGTAGDVIFLILAVIVLVAARPEVAAG